MAQRRMFSLKIIDTDLFLDMPSSSQLLYFHLSMRADDDGFVASPKKIKKMVNCSDDDLKILTSKNFIIPFESGICVIKHWKIHNYIQKDRYDETQCLNEKSQIFESENGVYEREMECTQNGYKVDTQVRLGKVSLELGKDSIGNTTKVDCSSKLQPVLEKWNTLNLSKLLNIKGTRLKLLNARIKEYGLEDVLKAIDNINCSSFLKGQNNRSWVITFDWFIKPNNFTKVLENNYADKEVAHGGSGQNNETSKKQSNTESEGDRLARRATEKYGTNLADVECEF